MRELYSPGRRKKALTLNIGKKKNHMQLYLQWMAIITGTALSVHPLHVKCLFAFVTVGQMMTPTAMMMNSRIIRRKYNCLQYIDRTRWLAEKEMEEETQGYTHDFAPVLYEMFLIPSFNCHEYHWKRCAWRDRHMRIMSYGRLVIWPTTWNQVMCNLFEIYALNRNTL